MVVLNAVLDKEFDFGICARVHSQFQGFLHEEAVGHLIPFTQAVPWMLSADSSGALIGKFRSHQMGSTTSWT